jgi:hypothetical protein
MRKLRLLESLFLDKKLNRIDSLIPTLIISSCGNGGGSGRKFFAGGPKGHNASSVGWVAVAVAAVSVVLAIQKGLHWHLLIRVSCLVGSNSKLTRCQ